MSTICLWSLSNWDLQLLNKRRRFLNKVAYYYLWIEPLLVEMNDCAIFTDFIHLKVGESTNGQIQCIFQKFPVWAESLFTLHEAHQSMLFQSEWPSE